MTINPFGDSDTCVKIYNPLETDVNKKLIGTYQHYHEAGGKMGILPKDVYRACASKKQIYSQNHKMMVAVRLASSNK